MQDRCNAKFGHKVALRSHYHIDSSFCWLPDLSVCGLVSSQQVMQLFTSAVPPTRFQQNKLDTRAAIIITVIIIIVACNVICIIVTKIEEN